VEVASPAKSMGRVRWIPRFAPWASRRSRRCIDTEDLARGLAELRTGKHAIIGESDEPLVEGGVPQPPSSTFRHCGSFPGHAQAIRTSLARATNTSDKKRRGMRPLNLASSLVPKMNHSPSSESFSPSSRNATLVSSTFCGETPSGGATSTRSVSFKPAVAANFESTFV
jgi:hypothetical protein